MTQRDVKSGMLARLMIALIRGYQLTLSALLGRTCRHLPTCSEYAREAIALHGAWRGFWLGFSRILRCSPIGTHGFDPVPQSLPECGWRFWQYGRWRRSELTSVNATNSKE